MNKLLDKKWWVNAGVRALKTFCQTAITMFTVGQAITDIDWLGMASISLVSAILSILTSIATLPEEETNTED